MAVEAVIFDWGGTLTPWRTVDYVAEWRTIAAIGDLPTGHDTESATAALHAAASQLWARARDEHRSATIAQLAVEVGQQVSPQQVLLTLAAP